MHVGITKTTMSSSSSRPRTRRQLAVCYKNAVHLKNKNQASNGSGINSGLVKVKIEQDDNYVPIKSGFFDVKIEVDYSCVTSNVVSVDRVSTSVGELNLRDVNCGDDLGKEIVVSESNVSNVGEKTNLFDVLEEANALPQLELVVNNSDLDNSRRNLDSTEHLNRRRSSRLKLLSNVDNVGEKTNLFDVLEEANALLQLDLVGNNSDLDDSKRNSDSAENLNRRRSLRLNVDNVGEKKDLFDVLEEANALPQVELVASNSDLNISRCNSDNAAHLNRRRSSRLRSALNVGNLGEKTNLFNVLEEADALPQVELVVSNSDLDNSRRNSDSADNLNRRRSSRLRSVSNVGNVGEKTSLFNVLEEADALPQVDLVVNNSNLDNSRRNSESDEHLKRRRSSRLRSLSNVSYVGEKTNLFNGLEEANSLPQFELVDNNSDLDKSRRNSDSAEHLKRRRSSRLRSVSNVGNLGEKTNLVDVVEAKALPQVDCNLFDVVVNTSGSNNSSRDLDGAKPLDVEIVSNGSSLGNMRSSRLRSVSNVANRNGDKNMNHVGSLDLVANNSGSDKSGQSSDESDGEAEHLGWKIVSNGSSLGKRRSSRLRLVSNVGNGDGDGDENTNLFDCVGLVENTSDSDDSSQNSDGSDAENEHLRRENVSNGSSLDNRRDPRLGPASNVENLDENVNRNDYFDLVSNSSDSDNLGGDSDGSDLDQSVDSKSSSDEEDTEDPSSGSTEDDDSDDSDFLGGEVGYYSNKVLRTNGDAWSSEDDITGDKAFRSGRKVKRMKFSGDVSKDDSYYSHKNGLNKRKLSGLEIMVHFGEISETELRSFKCQKKDDSQLGKSTWPSPMINGDKTDFSTDDAFESLRRELCGRQRKVKYTKKRSHAARSKDLINILVGSMKSPIEGGDTRVHQPLPLKFKFEDDVNPPHEKSECEKEIDSLFRDMELALRASEIDDSAVISKKANEDQMSTVNDKSRTACCGGESILDEQIGIICRSCGDVLLEIKDILPPWYTPSWKQHDRNEFFKSQRSKVGEFQFREWGDGHQGQGSFTRTKGTVWDLIPGFEKDMFPHQCEGFEFLWKNIAGDIRIEKLPETLPNDSKGCIMSHAPGTGKTRLTIVFLLSFLKRYPNANPVIIAPRGMLDTWEDEFIKWKVNIPFHNMNSDLSANEIQLTADKAGWQVKTSGGMNKEDVRLVKLCSWILSGGVLGISYQLFEGFASNCKRGEKEGVIWKTLVEKPGVLIMDEGHYPRNRKSNIWNALRKVATQRRVILSGTPFQNNFKELYNTFCLIDPKFLKVDKATWKKLTEGKNLNSLRSMLDPYVHLHKGTILQQSLPGLRDSIVFLQPPKLQKELLDAARKVKNFLTKTRLVSLISVHPSMALIAAESTKFSKNRTFSLYKDELQKIESDLDAGVKLQFVINLIQLADALGERVLVFGQYIYPLIFIKQQLKARFSWRDGKEVLYMDGQLETKHRQDSISTLNNNSSEAKVLLASERACSEGINLIGASRVILLDTVWNPSVERQAISRAYRLGQKKMVYVYRLIISGMEVRQYELQAQKDHISQMIFSPVDGRVRKVETSGVVSEDKILEQMHNLKSCAHIFEKIVHQPKECGLIETFGFV